MPSMNATTFRDQEALISAMQIVFQVLINYGGYSQPRNRADNSLREIVDLSRGGLVL
jgi:hypothetical protein